MKAEQPIMLTGRLASIPHFCPAQGKSRTDKTPLVLWLISMQAVFYFNNVC